MKKSNIILLFAAGTVLASCGAPSITREQASENLTKSAQHVASADFKTPTKVTAKTTSKIDGKESTAEIAYDLDNTYYRYSDSDDSRVWVYADGDKFVYASSTDAGKTGIYSYVTKAEALKEMEADGLIDLSETYKAAADSLKGIVDALGSNSSSGSASVPGTKIEKNEFKESYTSTGDGNLTMNLSYNFVSTVEVLGVKNKSEISMELNFTIDKYLPSKSHVKTYINTSFGGGSTSVQGEEGGAFKMDILADGTYNWGTCDMSKPDISKFTEDK